MPFNLISEAWIPVRTTDDKRRVIRPDQIVEPGIARPDWQRADFNLACYELLIGLVYLADPPRKVGDWRKRRAPDPERFRQRLAPLAPAFNLDGDGPRFLQDFDDLESTSNDVDMLFIDSAGGNTAKNNADLMVKRDRYPGLPFPEAAMALFTLQSQAPSGGAGNRTSMRGGGPLITLMEPRTKNDTPLWEMVWANVPDGVPLDPALLTEALPWMRQTKTSDKGQVVQPPENGLALAEAFFGMPRRLRLDFSNDGAPLVTGVRQRPYGTNYGLWEHPLSPYYQQKAGGEKLPMHPRAGANSYRNWEGIAFERTEGLRKIAGCVRQWRNRTREPASLHVGGWSMDNMKPRDFLWSKQPFFALESVAEDAAVSLIEAANAFSLALAGAMQSLTGAGSADATAVETVREAFFTQTQNAFEEMLGRLAQGEAKADIAEDWRKALKRTGLSLFEDRALPGLSTREISDTEKIVKAHGQLQAAFRGYGNKTGKAAFGALGLDPPKSRKKKEEPA